jgi:hypothetical protein
MASTPPESAAAMTGARNETSVLFTLDQLTRPKAKPAPKAEKIDADALLAPAPAVQLEEDGPPSVAKIGGGGLFPTAAMAAPDFTAPAVPSAPSHPPPSAGTHAAAPAQERSGGGSTLWIVLGALGVVGAGTASYFFMVRAPETPGPETPTTATTEPAATAPTAKVEMTATAAPTETASSAPAATPSAAATAPVATQAAPTATAMPTGTAAPAAPATAPVATAGTAAQPKPTAAAPGQPKPTATVPETPATPAEGPAFDKEAAAAALGAAAAQAQSECASQEGTHGSGKVTVTFVNSGRATNALVSGDFAGSALGGCIARVFRGAKVPAFGGDSVRVTKGVQIP